ncbi:fimbrial protein [Vibrio harveyi]|uniref:fimbrial protein n=1 Tax=Vibrio harveyi TaxID=669 RepID=UPI0023803F55|nr:fimbrial protein [Vibrio harveyi]HDM8061266.1 type 1 fimbrial protein [Vibrio harveyi]HDM8211271.1 type 1 fimbrial protein [Vibrio harveyi]
MKLNKLVAILGSFLFTSSVLAASANTITFQGEVTDETCTVSVNGENASPVVLLETVPKSELAKSGDTAGATEFEVSISGCTGNATTGVPNISTVFVGNQVTGNGNLGNTGSATNVELQILDTSDSAIDLSGGYKGSNDLALAAGEKANSATYKAQYYATGASTAGTVNASLQYAVSYQ